MLKLEISARSARSLYIAVTALSGFAQGSAAASADKWEFDAVIVTGTLAALADRQPASVLLV
jgi:hypothetical protein|nr:hypothetical protein [Oxalobacteraceae bacterium]